MSNQDEEGAKSTLDNISDIRSELEKWERDCIYNNHADYRRYVVRILRYLKSHMDYYNRRGCIDDIREIFTERDYNK